MPSARSRSSLARRVARRSVGSSVTTAQASQATASSTSSSSGSRPCGHPDRISEIVRGLPDADQRPTSILVILSLRAGPFGTGTETMSLRFLPIRARPTGDSLESLSSAGLASADPTIVYFWDLPVFSSLTWTTEPTPTTSVETSLASMICAARSFSSSWAMRDSSMACSFLASSYSEFSEMSPNSRASLMRSATSRRFSPERTSSSSLSLSRPSLVRITSRGIWSRHASNEQLPGLKGAGRPLQSLVEHLVSAQSRHVPGVGLAQPAGRPLVPQMLDRPVDHPVQLGADLLLGGFVRTQTKELLEQPGVAQRAAGEHDGGGARALVCGRDLLGPVQA